MMCSVIWMAWMPEAVVMVNLCSLSSGWRSSQSAPAVMPFGQVRRAQFDATLLQGPRERVDKRRGPRDGGFGHNHIDGLGGHTRLAHARLAEVGALAQVARELTRPRMTRCSGAHRDAVAWARFELTPGDQGGRLRPYRGRGGPFRA